MSKNSRSKSPETQDEKLQALLDAAKLAYELTAGWKYTALFNGVLPDVGIADIRDMNRLELRLEEAIFAVEPDYEP